MSTISNTGYFNTDYAVDPPLEHTEDEDDVENQKNEPSTGVVRKTLASVATVAYKIQKMFGWNKTVPGEESVTNYSDTDSNSY